MARAVVKHAPMILFILDSIDRKLSEPNSTFAEKANSRTQQDHFLHKQVHESRINHPDKQYGTTLQPYELGYLRDNLSQAIKHDSAWATATTTKDQCISELFRRGTQSLNPTHLTRLKQRAASKPPTELQTPMPDFADTPDPTPNVTPEKPAVRKSRIASQNKPLEKKVSGGGDRGVYEGGESDANEGDGEGELRLQRHGNESEDAEEDRNDEENENEHVRMQSDDLPESISTGSLHRTKASSSIAEGDEQAPLSIASDSEDSSMSDAPGPSPSKTAANRTVKVNDKQVSKPRGAPSRKRKAETPYTAEGEESDTSRQPGPKRFKSATALSKIPADPRGGQHRVKNRGSQEPTRRSTRQKSRQREPAPVAITAPPADLPDHGDGGGGDDDDNDDDDGGNVDDSSDGGGPGGGSAGHPIDPEQADNTRDILSTNFSDIIPNIHSQITAATKSFFFELADPDMMCQPDQFAFPQLAALYTSVLGRGEDGTWKSRAAKFQPEGLLPSEPFLRALIWAHFRIHIFNKPDVSWEAPHKLISSEWAPYLRAALSNQRAPFEPLLRKASLDQIDSPAFKNDILRPAGNDMAANLVMTLASHFNQIHEDLRPKSSPLLLESLRSICPDVLILHGGLQIIPDPGSLSLEWFSDCRYLAACMEPDACSGRTGDRVAFTIRPAMVERCGGRVNVHSKASVVLIPRKDDDEGADEEVSEEEGPQIATVRKRKRKADPSKSDGNKLPTILEDDVETGTGNKETRAQPPRAAAKIKPAGGEKITKSTETPMEPDNVKRPRTSSRNQHQVSLPLPANTDTGTNQEDDVRTSDNPAATEPPRQRNASKTTASNDKDRKQRVRAGSRNAQGSAAPEPEQSMQRPERKQSVDSDLPVKKGRKPRMRPPLPPPPPRADANGNDDYGDFSTGETPAAVAPPKRSRAWNPVEEFAKLEDDARRERLRNEKATAATQHAMLIGTSGGRTFGQASNPEPTTLSKTLSSGPSQGVFGSSFAKTSLRPSAAQRKPPVSKPETSKLTDRKGSQASDVREEQYVESSKSMIGRSGSPRKRSLRDMSPQRMTGEAASPKKRKGSHIVQKPPPVVLEPSQIYGGSPEEEMEDFEDGQDEDGEAEAEQDVEAAEESHADVEAEMSLTGEPTQDLEE